MYIDNDRFKGRCKDLRKGRYSENGRIYLVTTVTCQREKVFSNFYLGRIVVRSMLQQEQQDRVNSLAFVVMPDHLHWLLCLKNDWTIAKVMQNVKGSSAFLIQKFLREQYGADVSRSLWQAGYYDHTLRKEEDLHQCARYIVANPLRAGLVNKIADYPLWDAVWI